MAFVAAFYCLIPTPCATLPYNMEAATLTDDIAPISKSPDWTLAQSLYVQGVAPKDIAEQIGVSANAVSIRASRENWKEQAIRNKTKLVAEIAEEWQLDQVIFLRERADRIARLKVDDSVSERRKYEDLVQVHVELGRKILGLDRLEKQTVFNRAGVVIELPAAKMLQ